MVKRKKMSALQKKKNNPRSRYWMKKADKEWAQVVRAVGECAYCQSTHRLEAHHLIRRTNYYLRHNPYNGICLCSKHHLFDVHIAAHGSTDITDNFSIWLQEKVEKVVDGEKIEVYIRPYYEWMKEHEYTREGELDYEARYYELLEMQVPQW